MTGIQFEVGKQYIVDVTNNGIIPIEEFNSERFFDKEHDDLVFLTDKEKDVIINNALNKIRAEIEEYRDGMLWSSESLIKWEAINYILEQIIDKYKAESERKINED